MCYDISFTVNIKQLSDYFPNLIFDDQIEIRFDPINWNPVHILGHAYGNHPIVYRNRDDGQLHCKLMEWGVIPFYIKDSDGYLKQRATMLNARSERILDDPTSYWYKIRNRRCLIPVKGFFEHREVKGMTKKVPYYLTVKNQDLLFIPGLYSVAEIVNKETGEIEKVFTFTLITRAANSLMEQIHNGGDNKWRMPLMVPFELSKKWVEDELSEEEYRGILNYELPSLEMDYRTVYTIRSKNARPDDKEKNEQYEWGDKVPKIVI